MTDLQPTKGKLYLIPNTLGAEGASDMLAPWVKQQVHHLLHFVAENEKAARALIKNLQLAAPQSELHFVLLNQHTSLEEKQTLLNDALQGHDMGLISDAGLPCVADPGAEAVALAHQLGIEVVPLHGPSSLLLALMASGFNGQSFAFVGYLPIDKAERVRRIKELEKEALTKKQTQLFIETPYRNNSLLEDLLKNLQPDTQLCVAANLTQPNQFIRSTTVQNWKTNLPDLHKQPAVFVLG
ncbi:MAG: SAM-dependent methyltransferase [Bacteroidia bacterium]|nr:SAM-dependent methyltransferase [Bacteroidia bacterium]MBP9180424.1 SAM-dependent methyltransferase [Bacteroidia bacterium]MBP9724572.1 SAM-dependent methyltransferase [Bacteroidia bacterium]